MCVLMSAYQRITLTKLFAHLSHALSSLGELPCQTSYILIVIHEVFKLRLQTADRVARTVRLIAATVESSGRCIPGEESRVWSLTASCVVWSLGMRVMNRVIPSRTGREVTMLYVTLSVLLRRLMRRVFTVGRALVPEPVLQ